MRLYKRLHDAEETLVFDFELGPVSSLPLLHLLGKLIEILRDILGDFRQLLRKDKEAGAPVRETIRIPVFGLDALKVGRQSLPFHYVGKQRLAGVEVAAKLGNEGLQLVQSVSAVFA
jgi:hypothetical protein